VTPHSIVRALPLLGLQSDSEIEGDAGVRTIGAERPDTKVAVILGVDTDLDFHVAVIWADAWARPACQQT
jgi:hypothetical protein